MIFSLKQYPISIILQEMMSKSWLFFGVAVDLIAIYLNQFIIFKLLWIKSTQSTVYQILGA